MISPAIHFPGNCAEAIEFYKEVFNATDINIAYVREAPSGSGITVSEDTRNQVMHASITLCGTQINMSDSQDELITGNRFILNVFLDSADLVCDTFHKLKEGGKIIVDLGPQFFSPLYGSVEDRFGIHWQLIS